MARLSLCGYTPFKSADDFKEQLHVMLGAFSRNTMEGVTDIERQIIIDSAAQALRHEFDLLGSGPVSLNPIDWHQDFKSGNKWEKSFYREIKRTPGSDIKVPWELSRCQHLLWLGEAYLLSKDKRYAQEIIDEISWWIEDNPLMYSVNWTCSMDVAFRAVNWMFALNMIAGYEGFDDAFTKRVSSSLWQHGFFISNNLEKSFPWSNNHYTSDLVGLIYISTLFNHISKAKKWQQKALNEFYKETRKQILPSGVHYEKSISYHRLMVELTSYPLSMLIRMGERIPEDIINITQRMFDYVGEYIKPNGKAPLLADNDDGRFLPFTYGDFQDHRYLLDNDGIDRKLIDNGIESPFKLCYCSQSKSYDDAGIAIIKNHDAYLLINNSGYSKHEEPNKKNIGTHTHNDLLSFELSIGKEDIIIDPGTYLYTSSISARNEFRSTKKHNTAMVDGEEQNILSKSSAFSLTKNNVDRRLDVIDNVIMGSYETIKGGLKHERTFVLTEGQLEISDQFYKVSTDHSGKLFFHLSDEIIYSVNCGDFVSVESSNYSVLFRWTAKNTKGKLTTHIENDTISPSYGIVKPSKCLIVDFDFNDECTIKTSIEWKKK